MSPDLYSRYFSSKKFRKFKKKRIFAVALREKQLKIIAKIAQLVEHDLAKVGVAGSSPVFRSNTLSIPPGWWNGRHEGLKILWLHGCAGSSPASGTLKEPFKIK